MTGTGTQAHQRSAMLKIKVCGMTMKENMRKVMTLGVDMMGLIFSHESPRAVKPKRAFIDFLQDTGDIKKVGIFVDPGAQYVQDIIGLYRLDMIQLHGQESADFCHLFHNKTEVIKAFGIDPFFDFKLLEKYRSSCHYLLFDTRTSLHGGSGKVFDWELLREKNIPLPFLLSGGIDGSMAERILALGLPNLYGIDLNSRFESKPGIKDIEKVKRFINEIRSGY